MDTDRRSDITLLIAEARDGGADAHEKLVQAIYAELRREAGRRMYRERPDHTLQPSALVHEAVIRLLKEGVLATAPNRRFLFAVAAEAMRRILIEHERYRRAQKRNGDRVRVPWDEALVAIEEQGLDVIALHEALDRLALEHPRPAQVVTLRYFGGLSIPEVAESLGISPRTVDGDWKFARAWLMGQLGDSQFGGSQ
jgi:RNA polymerase sigma-70 factor (ECF subfamily)